MSFKEIFNMNYQQCNRCVMDNKSDKSIVFDDKGFCNYCSTAIKNKNKVYFPNEQGAIKLEKLINKIKTDNKNEPYDCLMGISGGLDSSYLAYLGAEKWGLRILGIHINDGFNSEISERNIERISKFPNLDMKTIHIDKEQYAELIKAFMRSGVPNITMPQDNILFASLYKFVKEHKVKTLLSGFNFALESIIQKDNIHSYLDFKNLIHIQKLFGKGQIDKLEFISSLKADVDYTFLRFERHSPLDYVNFDKNKALEELNAYCGFEYYGEKHQENEFTKFGLQYWMYNRNNVDIRTSYFSSLIVSGQMSREEALKELSNKPYNEEDMEKSINSILEKINMSRDEFETVFKQPAKQHSDYKTSSNNIFVRATLKIIRILSGRP